MFEEKIKLNPIEIDNVVEKEIYGQKVKFNKYLEQDYCKIIIDICIESFIDAKDKDFSRKDTLKGNDSKNSKIDTIKEQKEKFNLVNGNNVSQEKQSDIEENK